MPPLPITQLDVHQADPELDGQRISLGFSDPTPIRDILLLLVRDTRLSVIPDPSLEQTFIGDLKNVSLREALDLILEPLGLDYSVRGQVIRVFPRELETRFYSIDYVITQRTGSRSIAASTGASGANGLGAGSLPSSMAGGAAGANALGGGAGGAQGGSTSQVSGTDSPNLYVDLAEGVRTLLSEDGRMSLDRTAALLQVTDTPSRLARVEQYLEAVMLRVTRQVQIEAKIIEVELREEFSAGINWRVVLGNLTNNAVISQTLAPATAGGFTLALQAGDFTALLNAFAVQGKVNVLSSPRITAMNNEPAVMRIGTQDVFFVTTTQVDPLGNILQTTVTPQTLTEGVTLSVTPQVSADGIIHLSISPSITEKTGTAVSRLGDTVPIISVRETDTLVRVRQGETIVIAGLMQDRAGVDTGKIPLIGDVPVVGNLFRRTDKIRRKTDLVILLTPTVMGPGEITALTSREIQRLDDARALAAKTR
jgi:MSHA biogenesis protein MshL